MNNNSNVSRRGFAALVAGLGAAAKSFSQEIPQNTGGHPEPGTGLQNQPGDPFFDPLHFSRKPVESKVRPFPSKAVLLTAGPFKDLEDANRGFLLSLPTDRLLHNFRVNAGLGSSAQPLGGWEAPDCELRGHFVGHYLSACALFYAATGDQQIKARGDELVAELAKCQDKLAGGYLSAFPPELFARLKQHQKVWAPFYTYHKIMAGMLDMYEQCANQQALAVAKNMAHWTDEWSASLTDAAMQRILDVEYGGMNEVLYNLAAATKDDHYAEIGDRFTKKRFFNPLALRRDELAGLHVNTHIPQIIGAARRYELTGDLRFHDVADFFWYEVTSARTYVTGGTSNGESWHGEPRHLAAELKVSSSTTECCCAYNMLKLTRHLYSWTADPRYFDYYERTLFNHRLGTVRKDTGATMYYLSIVPGAWKTFNTQFDSFWCCTGTGTEEYSKLNDSIYFHDDEGLFVNLFIASELQWPEKGIAIRQETTFPLEQATTLIVEAAHPVSMPIHLRVPGWLAAGGSIRVNGRDLAAFPSPGSYLSIHRTWRQGDKIQMKMPMRLHIEAMPDDTQLQAVLYGPLVLAGLLGSEGLVSNAIIGPLGPDLKGKPREAPAIRTADGDLLKLVKPASAPLVFELVDQDKPISLVPLNTVFDRRYSIFWRV